MPAYVTLPGTSGNYFSTPDVNLLDADTAHGQQGDGRWTSFTNNTVVQDATHASALGFADTTHKIEYRRTDQLTVSTSQPTGTSAIPCSPSTQYTVSVWYYIPSTEDLDWIRFRVRDYDSGGTLGSNLTQAFQAAPQDAWTQHTYTFTTASDAAYVAIYGLDFATAESPVTIATDQDVWFGQVCLRTGSDGTFVRSLRIVNDLEIEWKVALDDYTPAATNTILDCLSTNDGYRIRHTTSDLIEVAYGNGSSTRAQTSSATGLTDGDDHVFKVTVDQSTGAVVYYIDGVQHDTDTMTTGAGSLNINDLVVGANAAASANWTDGDIYYVIVRDGIDGPVVARFDADDWVGV